jgi:ribosomal protein S18 acetylase RimI-like enzyme
MSNAATIREATLSDMAHVLRQRRLMFEDMGYRDPAALDGMERSSKTYFESAIGDGSYRGWLAETDDGEIVAGGGIVISRWPGHPSAPEPRRATILNMYTNPAFRRRGIARTLITTMMKWLRDRGFHNVSLHASQFGRPLYEDLGFRPTNELRFKFEEHAPKNSSTCCRPMAGENANDSETETPAFLRKAKPEDGDAILACLAAAFEPYRNQYTSEAFCDTVLTPESVRHRLSAMCVLVAISKGKAVGTIGCHKISDREGHLRGMAVLPEWQGSGVARALLHAAETGLRTNQCERVTLDTTEPLRRGVRFYEKHGFRPTGRVSDFFGMPLYEYVKLL